MNPSPKHRLHRFLRFFKYLTPPILLEVVRRSIRHRLNGLSAEIAYNAIFSLFPAILALVSAIALIPWPESQFRSFISEISLLVPIEALNLIRNFWRSLRAGSNQGFFSLSFLISLWISSNVLSTTMAALDLIHQVPRRRRRPFWKAKIVAITLGCGSFLMLLLAITIIGIGDFAMQFIAHPSNPIAPFIIRIWRWLSFPAALSIITIAMGLIYRYGPSQRHPGTPIMPGAILAALLWVLISWGLRAYIAQFGNYNQVYGTIGAVIILLLWLYLSAFSLLLGSQLNIVVGEAIHKQTQTRQLPPP